MRQKARYDPVIVYDTIYSLASMTATSAGTGTARYVELTVCYNVRRNKLPETHMCQSTLARLMVSQVIRLCAFHPESSIYELCLR